MEKHSNVKRSGFRIIWTSSKAKCVHLPFFLLYLAYMQHWSVKGKNNEGKVNYDKNKLWFKRIYWFESN